MVVRTRRPSGRRTRSKATWRGLVAACLVVFAATITIDATAFGTGLPDDSDHRGPAEPVAGLWVESAILEYEIADTGDAVVELRFTVHNSAEQPSPPPTIWWEPLFAQDFALERSEPPPVDAEQDQAGWGVFHSEAIESGDQRTFRLWFHGLARSAPVPRVVISVGDPEGDSDEGSTESVVWDGLVMAANLFPNGEAAWPAFEHNALVRVADATPAAWAAPGTFLRIVTPLAVLLAGVLAGGCVAAFRAVGVTCPNWCCQPGRWQH